MRTGDGGGGGNPHPAASSTYAWAGVRGGHPAQVARNRSAQPGGGGGGGAGTTNPGGTRKPDIPLKGIRNPILQDPDNPLKVIWDIVQNEIRSQWPRGLTMPTSG